MNKSVLPHPSMIDRLVEVARRLRTHRRPTEAADLLEIAAALSPKGAAALREEADRLRGEDGIEDFDREFKRRNLEASHSLGMAHIFETRGEFGRAVDMIDLAKLVRKAFKKQTIMSTISVRGLLAWSEKIEATHNIGQSLKLSWYNKLCSNDRQVVEDMYHQVFSKKIGDK